MISSIIKLSYLASLNLLINVSTYASYTAELGVGANQLYKPSASNVVTAASFPNDYYKPSNVQDSVLYLINLGYEWKFHQKYIPYIRANFEFQTIGANKVSGDISDFSLSWHYSYNYQYTRQSYLVNAEWFITEKYNILPYLVTGIGVSRNTVGHFSEEAYPGIYPRVPIDFANTTSTSFTYQLGVGINYRFTSNLNFSVQYAYLDAGNIKFNPSSARIGARGPQQTTQTNLWLFKVGYNL